MRRVITVGFHKGNMWMFVKCLLCTRRVTGNAPLLRADAKDSPSGLQVSNKMAPATLWLHFLLFSFPLPTLGTTASLFLKHAIQAPTSGPLRVLFSLISTWLTPYIFSLCLNINCQVKPSLTFSPSLKLELVSDLPPHFLLYISTFDISLFNAPCFFCLFIIYLLY